MLDPAAMAGSLSEAPGRDQRPPGAVSIGASFQLALLAAGQGNDQEAGDYLRQIIAAMKGMVKPGGAGAGAG